MNKILSLIGTLLLVTGCSSISTKRVMNQTESTQGTGFNITHDSRVFGVTAGHVCRKAAMGYLTTFFEGKIEKIRVLKKDNVYDLCILERIPGAKTFTLDTTDTPPTAVKVIGYPGGAENNEITTTGTVTGILFGPRLILTEDDDTCDEFAQTYIEDGEKKCIAITLSVVTDAQAYKGNSGGPVLNDKNEVLGVLTSIASPLGNPSFFTPTPLIIEMIKDLK